MRDAAPPFHADIRSLLANVIFVFASGALLACYTLLLSNAGR